MQFPLEFNFLQERSSSPSQIPIRSESFPFFFSEQSVGESEASLGLHPEDSPPRERSKSLYAPSLLPDFFRDCARCFSQLGLRLMPFTQSLSVTFQFAKMTQVHPVLRGLPSVFPPPSRSFLPPLFFVSISPPASAGAGFQEVLSYRSPSYSTPPFRDQWASNRYGTSSHLRPLLIFFLRQYRHAVPLPVFPPGLSFSTYTFSFLREPYSTRPETGPRVLSLFSRSLILLVSVKLAFAFFQTPSRFADQSSDCRLRALSEESRAISVLFKPTLCSDPFLSAAGVRAVFSFQRHCGHREISPSASRRTRVAAPSPLFLPYSPPFFLRLLRSKSL